MVIVKSKITGKFLRQHSGSANEFKGRMRLKVLKDKTLRLPPKSMADQTKGEYSDWFSNPKDERHKAIKTEIHKRMYDAEALEARRYASPGSATSSVGRWRHGESGSKYYKYSRVYYLPDHLEIHEIVAGNLCLVSPDDDEETKLRKKENCNE